MHPMTTSKILADEYNIKILTACFEKPSSAQKLAVKYDIPIAACYRKIAQLENAGLLVKEKQVLTKQGKRVWLYRSLVKSIHLTLERGRLMARLELSEETEKVDSLWNSVDVLTIQK